MTRIEEYGFRGAVEPGVGRIVRSHGDYYHLVCNESAEEIVARKKKSVFAGKDTKTRLVSARGIDTLERGMDVMTVPVTGDFVRFKYNAQGESMITETLPRFSVFERKDSNARRKSQILAVNFDYLFVMTSLNENFSIPRLERYVSLASGMGEAKVVLVFTKADIPGAEAADRTASEMGALFGVDAFAISSLTGHGMEKVRDLAHPRVTIAFVGSSGVGKSTLLNTLAGEEIAATLDIQEWSGKGRHATTSRSLFKLPSGALVVDTPGVREIGIVGETEEIRAKGTSTHRWRK